MPAVGWSQVHADGASQGSRFVNTLPSLKLLFSVDVGHVVFSSPVIGPDGTIFVGNLEGQLIAINPDGTIKFQFEAGVPILGAPVAYPPPKTTPGEIPLPPPDGPIRDTT